MSTISSILIANRGEIASRIIRSCRKMGIQSIAIFSDADRQAPYVQEADIAIHIGESSPTASYLDQEKIIQVAQKVGANAIHPGFGFLAENAEFAEKCQAAELTFIGPQPDAIRAMGSKSKAKAIMQEHDVPTISGYQGDDQSVATLTKAAQDIGFPVLLKATAGGGGKGMRIVHEESEVEQAINAAKREAQSAFGDDELIIEKYIASGRHIEFQILGDQHGHVIHLLERECTIQRRYQKIIEESPSPVLTSTLRQEMGEAAVKAAQAINYSNAGTVEFILAENNAFYFLEVNTRLQVEHPVTEEITGVDLVALQIEMAEGKPLTLQQTDIQSKGYAIECRLYAEDAANNFLPVTGKILQWKVPEVDGLRMETGVESGSEISIYYDPMIAKIIVWEQTRRAAHRKMAFVLRHLVCLGITTNQDFLCHVLENPDFQAGNYDTHFIQNKLQLDTFGQLNKKAIHLSGIAATLMRWQERDQQRQILAPIASGWRNNFYQAQFDDWLIHEEEYRVWYRYQNGLFAVTIQEQEYTVRLIETTADGVRLEVDGVQHSIFIAHQNNAYFAENERYGNVALQLKERFPQKETEKVKGGYEAPMPSQVIKILVEAGQEVKAGEGLLVLSSMKMENTITANEDGVVEEIYATEGANIEADFLLIKVNGRSA